MLVQEPLNNQLTKGFFSLRAVDVSHKAGHSVALWVTAQPGVPRKVGRWQVELRRFNVGYI
jgi:hypothetical protein